MSNLVDLDVNCVGCGTPFVISAGEQEWMRSRFGKDYSPPKFCKTCRLRRKQEKAQR